MLKRVLLLFFALLLSLPFSLAEEAPAENPFLGVWEVLYYIEDEKPLLPDEAPENPFLFVFLEDAVECHFSDGEITHILCSYNGSTCTGYAITFVLEHENLVIGHATAGDNGLTFILTRSDPIVLNNPFIGTWVVLYGTENGQVQFPPHMLSIVFEAQQILIFTDEDQDAAYPCSYRDGQCQMQCDGVTLVGTIGEDGLLLLSGPEDHIEQIICVRQDEEAPEDISRFYGRWREVALIYNDILITDSIPFALRPPECGLLFQFDFSRGLVYRACEDLPEFPASHIPCTYLDGACTILYDDMPALCTIDANGLMCIRMEDGSAVSWLVRTADAAEEE